MANPQIQVPDSITKLDALFFEHFDAVVETVERFSAIASRINEICGERHERVHADISFSDFVNRDFEEYHRRVRYIACQEFSTPLAPFLAHEIHVLTDEIKAVSEAWRKSYDGDGRDAVKEIRMAMERCSPARLWASLAEHFNPDEQNRAAAQTHAAVLGRQLLPQRYAWYGHQRAAGADQDIKIVKGRVEICIDVHTEQRWSGRGREMRNCGLLREFAKAMDFALAQTHGASRPQCGAELGILADAYQMDRKELVSRERIDLGDGCEVVAGFQKFKLYLPQEVAGTLNMFLAEYGKPVV